MACSGQNAYPETQLALVHLDLSNTTVQYCLAPTDVPDPRQRMESLERLISLSPFLTTFVATGIDAGTLKALHAEQLYLAT